MRFVLVAEEPKGAQNRVARRLPQSAERGFAHRLGQFLLASEGLAVIIVSDDLPEVLACASRIIVMREGAFVRELDPASTTESALSELSTGVA